MNAPTGSDPERSDPDRPQQPRGEAPAWAPLVGLAGLVLMLLFTGWYIDTEPAPRWPDAAIRDARVERGVPDATVGAADGAAAVDSAHDGPADGPSEGTSDAGGASD